jgi:hypothetical protein
LAYNKPVCSACGFTERLPCWRTFERRFAAFSPEAEHQLQALGQYAIRKKYITGWVVSADKSPHWARGPLWHKKDRRLGRIPKKLRGVDRESEWGLSPYHHWVQGYAQHTIVNAVPGEARFPLDCTAGTANMAENRVIVKRLSLLPETVDKILLDGYYDDESVLNACRSEAVRPIVHMSKPGRQASSIRRWAWRIRSRKINNILYTRRRTTIEPTFGNGKKAFENDRVWFYGLKKNQTHLVMTHVVRAVAMIVNFRTGHPPEYVKELMDAWL